MGLGALLVVAGTVFAFKARSTQFVYVPASNTTDPATTICTSKLTGYTTLAVTTTTIWATTNSLQSCTELGVREGL
ncbi:hypothetical protein SAMN05216311_12093 [Chitinophaga sp. CF418]|nr:hypothetical protein SAMN05216311_12093 [Chitinophaga sp. CF418]